MTEKSRFDQALDGVLDAAEKGQAPRMKGCFVAVAQELRAMAEDPALSVFVHDMHIIADQAREKLGQLGPDIEAILAEFPRR